MSKVKTNSKVGKIFIWAILGCFTALMLYAVLSQVIGQPAHGLSYKSYTVGFWSLLGAIIILIAFFIFAVVRAPRFARPSFKVLLGLLVIGAIVTEIILAHALMSHGHAWDVGTIDIIARHYVSSGTTEIPNSWEQFYLAKYPNNVFVTMLIVGAYNLVHLFGNTSFTLSSQLLNSVALLATVFLVMFVAHKLYGRRAALMAFGFGYLLIILSAYTPITYTDTIGAFFVSLSVFCAVMMSHADGHRHLIWGWGIALGLALMLGYLIKPTILIILIALTLVFSVKHFSREIFKKQYFCAGGAVVAGLLIGCLGFRLTWRALPNFAHYNSAQTDKYEITQWQFLAMGSFRGLAPYTDCKSGSFCFDFVDYMQSGAVAVDTIQERKIYSQELWQSNVAQDFPIGWINLMLRKVALAYSDGSFGVWSEGTGLNSDIEFYNDNLLDQKIRESMGPTGQYLRHYKTFLQAVWLALLVIIIAGAIVAWRRPKWRLDLWRNVFALSVLGLTAFLMLFESRARYLFLFLPIFILLGTGSLRILAHEFKSSRLARRLNLKFLQ